MNAHFYFCAAVTLISGLVSLGFSVAAVLRSTSDARTLGLYACVRSLALCTISIVPLCNGSIGWLEASACSMIVVQAFDALIGVRIKDPIKTYGPAGTALLNLFALLLLAH